jgi:hypothetical protein
MFGTSWAVVDKNIHTIGAKQADLNICFHENCCLRNLVFLKKYYLFSQKLKDKLILQNWKYLDDFREFFCKNEHFREKEIL